MRVKVEATPDEAAIRFSVASGKIYLCLNAMSTLSPLDVKIEPVYCQDSELGMIIVIECSIAARKKCYRKAGDTVIAMPIKSGWFATLRRGIRCILLSRQVF